MDQRCTTRAAIATVLFLAATTVRAQSDPGDPPEAEPAQPAFGERGYAAALTPEEPEADSDGTPSTPPPEPTPSVEAVSTDVEADTGDETTARPDEPRPRGNIHFAGALYVFAVQPVDEGGGASPLSTAGGIGLEYGLGIASAFRVGPFGEVGLGGLDADAWGDRFKKEGGTSSNVTLRGGLRARVSPIPAGGVLPFLELSGGFGRSWLKLTGEKECTTVNGTERCVEAEDDRVSLSGSILSVGGGAELDLANTTSAAGYATSAPPGFRMIVRGGYGWYRWSGVSSDVHRNVVELAIGVSVW